MQLKKVQDIFALSSGQCVSKRNLYDLIQYSKVEGSEYWSGTEHVVGNTPQQGINWIGRPPSIRAVIIKARLGSYADNGWSVEDKTAYRYSFKAQEGKINPNEKANTVLIQQPEHLYPIFLFTEHADGWCFEGAFFVSDLEEKSVVLRRGTPDIEFSASSEEVKYPEGGRKYVTHLLAERNRGVVDALKDSGPWLCDICNVNFESQYGVKYIEAHHKVPIANYASAHHVHTSDFALLCPNCHRAVHIYMKRAGLEYLAIKNLLISGPHSHA
ncbi:HNH endonuclease [Paraburkholderia fungorum]|uniref:HNH endonuclease n=1 Tax=Paraburkholderia fungorum TaxID=134537 RepID=UPI001C1EDB16|nr:HNH endonuclease [Paraburkholderia fungorum]MBU7438594.1 HNH endonuclease [Paraburkholderia fungorum]